MTRCGMPTNIMLPQSSLGTTIKYDFKSNMTRVNRYQQWNSMPYKERSQWKIFTLITEMCTKHKLPKIIIPVHLSGQSCDMLEIYKLSKKYNFKIIEDASHGIGGKYKDEPIGNCKYSDITVFSFHPVKIITTGEGGMCTTNDHKIANRLCLFRSHGITRHENEMTKKSDGPWYYQQIELGFNYRMTDINAALGLSQLERLDEFISKRHSRKMT
jgi:dTDP-4-amino-4,6-dideoxygalactose transaminase